MILLGAFSLIFTFASAVVVRPPQCLSGFDWVRLSLHLVLLQFGRGSRLFAAFSCCAWFVRTKIP